MSYCTTCISTLLQKEGDLKNDYLKVRHSVTNELFWSFGQVTVKKERKERRKGGREEGKEEKRGKEREKGGGRKEGRERRGGGTSHLIH